MVSITLEEMFFARVHFGHLAKRQNPKMQKYVFERRGSIQIIDLVQTGKLLLQACNFLSSSAQNSKTILFVGTKRQAASIIAQEASRCKSFYINHRWLGGILTNWATIRTQVQLLKQLELKEENGVLDLLPKQEASRLRRQLDKLRMFLGGIKNMTKLPDIVIVVDLKREYNAILECHKLNIPVVGLVDTNCDPDLLDWPIPGNDDSILSINYIISKLADAIIEGTNFLI
uniref:Small ribosomal subunit protein uS2c n=1 Tax=Gloeochaete wittrockiana TaxID=38269 RepID=A0A3G1IVV5_9EUKA|nr:ribosomal protein S2 [Gloeochaete wittrockiana]ASQ40184.1 ribosomal protein S2 [Gloeochaete wittrockiana]